MRKVSSVAIISGPIGKSLEAVEGSFIFDEAYMLAKKGLKVHIIRPVFEKDSLSYGMYYYGIRAKIDVNAIINILQNIHKYPARSLLRNPLLFYWENLYVSNVLRVVKANKINLIHSHFAWPQGLVGLFVKYLINKPLVVSLHGYDILVEPSVNYGIRLDKNLDAIVREVLNHADVIITASSAVYKEALRIVRSGVKVQLVPMGVDIYRFNPELNGSYIKRKFGIENKTVIFTAKSHEPVYGIEYLIRAAAIVLKHKKNVIFVVGGDGSLRHYYEESAVRLGIRDKILFVGRIPRNYIPLYYAMSDIVVVPSLQEGFGLVVTEAMACGKPVIGTNVGGIPDQIIDGYNGFLVEPKNASQISEKIIYLIENVEIAKEMGLRGRKIVEEKFNIEKRIKNILDIYNKLVN
jgi:glycosyltransferase involved in cell wall biosynthesis